MTNFRWTIRWISQTISLTPLLDGGQKLKHPARNADLLTHHQRLQTIRRRLRLQDSVIRQLIRILLPDEQGRNRSSGARDDGHIRAVAKRLRLAAALGFGSVGAASPLVACVVAPLDYALRAGHVGGELHFVAEYCFFVAVFGDDVAVDVDGNRINIYPASGCPLPIAVGPI